MFKEVGGLKNPGVKIRTIKSESESESESGVGFWSGAGLVGTLPGLDEPPPPQPVTMAQVNKRILSGLSRPRLVDTKR
jgi:hypothetical protein